MFHYLMGTVAEIDLNLAVIDCGGVGFACRTTSTTLAQITEGARVKLYTYCNIREDSFDIFAFATMSEKRCFELLIGVSGVGPKAALAILSATTPEGLAMAVLAEDEGTITRAQGVGKKLAQRVILELKDKMGADMRAYAVSMPDVIPGGASPASDAAAALAVLGYGRGEISVALRDIDCDAFAVEEIVRMALKKMVK